MQIIGRQIKEWLGERGISEKILVDFSIGWNGSEIVIPIFDQEKNFLFNKYRRDPFGEEGPKYRYETGSSAALYNAHILKDVTEVLIVEGELDALRCLSDGIAAVSSTGGAGTFKPEWAYYFTDKKVVICYDYDEAGFRGALKIKELIPHANMVFLPFSITERGKDLTDFLKLRNMNAAHLIKIAEEIELECPEKSKTENIRWYKNKAEYYSEKRRRLTVARVMSGHCDMLSNYYLKRFREWKDTPARPKKTSYTDDGERMRSAKAVPITNYIEIKGQFAKCIFHNEDSGSLKYYPRANNFYCFGCGKYGDVIDIVQKLQNITLQEALDILAPKK